MTAKTKAVIDRLHAAQFAFRDRLAAHVAEMTPAEMDAIMVRAGILTKKGKLTARYRPNRAAA